MMPPRSGGCFFSWAAQIRDRNRERRAVSPAGDSPTILPVPRALATIGCSPQALFGRRARSGTTDMGIFSLIPLRLAAAAVAAVVAAAGCAAATPRAGAPSARPDILGPELRAAEALLSQGRLDAAAERFRELTAHDAAPPVERAVAWANLGVALGRQERWRDAANALETARGIAPDVAAIHFNLGLVYRHLGRFADARDSYLRAAELRPDDPEPAYNLGILYELYLNQPNEALAAYRRYAEAGGPDAERVRGWMDDIRRHTSAQ